MDLAQFISQNSYLRIFNSEQDELPVQDFMSAAPMRLGGLELVYDRSPKFQALLKAQSEKFVTLLARHQTGEVLGMFSFSFSPKYINGQVTPCAYIGDFRTDNSRASTKLWRKDYAKILSAIKQDPQYGRPQFILTAILEKNKEAIRSLAQSKKDLGFQYDPLCTVQMVNVFGVVPTLSKSNDLVVVNATSADDSALRIFLQENESKKQFGAVIADEAMNWNSRDKNWTNFSVENFLLIKDDQGQILACTMPWNPSELKRMKVLAAPKWMDRSFRFLNDLGFNFPTVGESLETVYLMHLCIVPKVKAHQVLYAFLKQVQLNFSKAHMISFADFDETSRGMKRLIAQRIGVRLFNVRLSEELPFAPTPKLGFEMALV